MDSKAVRVGILMVALFMTTLFLVVLAVNGVFEKKTVQAPATTVEPEEYTVAHDYSSWMKDEGFFDEVKTSETTKSDLKHANCMVSAIGKEIRVVITDDNGDLVSGRKFNAEVLDHGTYSDNDRDGIITINDMSPGEYQISINSLIGYRVPVEPVKVTVKAKIEYKALADISYLIKTEADIDAEKEDTAVNDADEESSGNTAIKTVEGASFGIDVSKWNGDIKWDYVQQEGVEFAIIRCGYRGSKTGAIVEDPYFRQNMEGAINAGIPVGVYFFTQAVSETEAIEEASAVLSLVKDYKLKYPIFIDSESAGGNGRADKLEVVDRSRILQAFCETIRSGGKYKAGVYASKNWFNHRLDISKLSADNVTWLAEYAEKATYGATYQMWQYSSAGRIPGIEGRVDMNLSYLDIGDNKGKVKQVDEADSKEDPNLEEKTDAEKPEDDDKPEDGNNLEGGEKPDRAVEVME